MNQYPTLSYKTVIARTATGGLLGALFGICFGALASVFQGGPELLQGMVESTPWFAFVGAFAAFLMSFEKDN